MPPALAADDAIRKKGWAVATVSVDALATGDTKRL
jgi:hypothetical protein